MVAKSRVGKPRMGSAGAFAGLGGGFGGPGGAFLLFKYSSSFASTAIT